MRQLAETVSTNSKYLERLVYITVLVIQKADNDLTHNCPYSQTESCTCIYL